MQESHHEDEPLFQKRREGLKAEVLNPSGEVSFLGAVLILFCTAVGAGIVAVPRAFSFAGWGAGMCVIMASAALTWLSLSCLFKCAQLEHGSCTYQLLVQKHLPRGLSRFVEVTLAMLLLGAIGTMLLLSLHVWQSLELAMGVAFFSPNQTSCALLCVASLLCFPRNLAGLQGLTVVNCCCTMSVVLIICLESRRRRASHEPPGFSAETSLGGMLSAVPIALYSFFCQVQAPQLYSEIQPAKQHSASLIAGAAVAACFSIYTCVGILGYSAFGSNTGSDILAQLTQADPTNHWMCLGQLLFGCVLLLSTPLVVSPLRSMLLSNVAKDVMNSEVSLTVHVATTIAIVGSALLVAIHVPGVDFIMGILGATCVVFLAMIVPGLLTLNCCGADWKIRGMLLVVGGLICTPVTFGAFMAQHFGYLSH